MFLQNLNNKSSSFSNDDVGGDGNNTAFHVMGRDDTLLKILAKKMNFKFEYVDVMSLVEMESYENVTQVSSIGLEMLKKRVIYLFHNNYLKMILCEL